MNGFFKDKKPHWLFLPFLSGILMALSFYPFGLWPLIFIAFAPLIYFTIATPDLSLRKLFVGGFVAGGLSALSFSYPFFGQFHWVKDTYLFETIIRLFFIPATLIGGLSQGAVAVFTRFLATRQPVFNAVIFSALFSLWLLSFQRLLGGFNYFDPAFAAVSVPVVLKFASIGGAPLVSFIVLIVNSFLSLIFATEKKRKLILQTAGVVAVFFVGLSLNEQYLESGESDNAPKTALVSIVQITDRKDNAFGSVKDGEFQYEILGNRIREATSLGSELIIYPFSPVSGAIAINGVDVVFNKKVLITDTNSFGKWVREQTLPSVTVLTWNSIYENSSFFNEYSFWKNGELSSRYQKRKPLPFADYTPKWAAEKGFYTTPFDVKTGSKNAPARLGDYSLGSLICSEVGDRELAQKDAKEASLIIAAGSDAMFAGDVAGRINLTQAQYRAAENNIPVIRANRLGPSAFILPDGTISKKMNYNEDGVLSDTVSLSKRKETFYAISGDTPLLVFLWLIISLAIILKHRRK